MITGLKKSDHIGFTVPNLDEAISFFKSLFKAETVGEAKDFKSDDNWMLDHLNVHPRAEIKKMVLLKLFDGTELEIFEYYSPDQQTQIPKNSDYGGHHLAFEVEDIDKAIEFIAEKGLKLFSTYTTNASNLSNIRGELRGLKWIYFESPWGMMFELVEK